MHQQFQIFSADEISPATLEIFWPLKKGYNKHDCTFLFNLSNNLCTAYFAVQGDQEPTSVSAKSVLDL